MKERPQEKTNFFSGKRILVTGDTGFKGSWLCQMLLNLGAEVYGYSLKPNTDPNLYSILNLKKKVKTKIADIRDYQEVLKTIKTIKPQIVFHLAAQPLVRDSYDQPVYTYETNVIGTVNVLEAIREARCVSSAVMITTDKVYENKERDEPYTEEDELGGYDPYSSSKACAEIAIKSYTRAFFNPKEYGTKHKTLVASARSGNVIGGGDWSKDRLIPDIIRALFVKNEKVMLRNPKSIRPWQHVLDPLTGYLLLAKKLYEGKPEFCGSWNFAPDTDDCIEVEELVKQTIDIVGRGRYEIKNTEEKHEMKTLRLDATKAKMQLEWNSSIRIKNGIKMSVEWYKEFYEGETNMETITDKQIQQILTNYRGKL